MKNFKRTVLAVAIPLVFQTGANAALVDLGTLVPQQTENVFSIIGISFSDDYTFNVAESFAFTSKVTGYDVLNFGISLSNSSNIFLFGQDSLTATTPITGFDTAVTASITEKTLGPGSYRFSLIGNTSDGSSAYQGSFTVGRPAPAVAAIPEPQTYAMFLAGLGLLGIVKRRKA